MQRAVDGCKVDKRAVGCCVSLAIRAVKPAGLQIKVDWIAHSIEPTSMAITSNDLYLVPALKLVAETAYYGQAFYTLSRFLIIGWNNPSDHSCDAESVILCIAKIKQSG